MQTYLLTAAIAVLFLFGCTPTKADSYLYGAIISPGNGNPVTKLVLEDGVQYNVSRQVGIARERDLITYINKSPFPVYLKQGNIPSMRHLASGESLSLNQTKNGATVEIFTGEGKSGKVSVYKGDKGRLAPFFLN